MASPVPDSVITSWTSLSNNSCNNNNHSEESDLCDDGFTHDNLTGNCYMVLTKTINFDDLYDEDCEFYGAEKFAIDSDLQIEGLLKLLYKGKNNVQMRDI
jgi:hypothetical protein